MVSQTTVAFQPGYRNAAKKELLLNRLFEEAEAEGKFIIKIDHKRHWKLEINN